MNSHMRETERGVEGPGGAAGIGREMGKEGRTERERDRDNTMFGGNQVGENRFLKERCLEKKRLGEKRFEKEV